MELHHLEYRWGKSDRIYGKIHDTIQRILGTSRSNHVTSGSGGLNCNHIVKDGSALSEPLLSARKYLVSIGWGPI